MTRKWNNLGVRQLKALRLISRTPRTVGYMAEKLGGEKTSAALLDTLIGGGFMQRIQGLCAITDHGRAVLGSPESYQKWRKQWGLS